MSVTSLKSMRLCLLFVVWVHHLYGRVEVIVVRGLKDISNALSFCMSVLCVCVCVPVFFCLLDCPPPPFLSLTLIACC